MPAKPRCFGRHTPPGQLHHPPPWNDVQVERPQPQAGQLGHPVQGGHHGLARRCGRPPAQPLQVRDLRAVRHLEE